MPNRKQKPEGKRPEDRKPEAGKPKKSDGKQGNAPFTKRPERRSQA